MNPVQKQHLIDTLRGALISGVLTAVFMYFMYFRGIQSLWAGLFIGSIIYLAIVTYTLQFADRFLRKTNLLLTLLTNAFFNVLIMLTVAWVGVGIFYMRGDFSVMLDNLGNIFGYYYLVGVGFGFVLSIFFNFFSIINTLIGKSVLGRLFIGRYRNPFEVDRIFMFLDIRSSTAIAEKIGHKKFLSLVNDFFYDIAIPVSRTKGEIYKYVGDAAIITWEMDEGLKQANCINCFSQIEERIRSKKEFYLEKYGLLPEFRAGMHGGTVITGELGYTRREIAYMGDVLNTTARIEEACKTYQSDFLVSETLLNLVKLPEHLATKKVGNVVLRGKSEEVGLIAVSAA